MPSNSRSHAGPGLAAWPTRSSRASTDVAIEISREDCELQHRLERSGGQRLEMRQFSAKCSATTRPRGGNGGSRIGDRSSQAQNRRFRSCEVDGSCPRKKSSRRIAAWPLHFALRLGALGTAGFWLVAVVSGESAQRGVVDEVTAFGIVAVEQGAHAVVEDFRRYAAKLGEGVGMASQQRLHVLVQHEAAPHHPAVAEHEREQPDDPLGSRLVGKDRAEMSEIHLRLTAGRRLETDLKAGGRSWTHLAQEILQRRVSAGISQPADLVTQPTAGQFRNCRDALTQVALEWRQLCRSRRPRSISRGSMPRAMYFATVLRCRPVRRAIAETVIPCWCSSNITISSANLTTHHLPRPIGGEVASVRTPFRQARLSQHSACRPRIAMSVFQSPDLARIHPAMTNSPLTLVLKAELEARIAALGQNGSWPAIIANIDALTETEVEPPVSEKLSPG